jgi:hypothetical protein
LKSNAGIYNRVGHASRVKPARSYLTSLNNFRGPIFRYELGDVATVGAGPCPCGRGSPLMASVEGKLSPLFHLPNGRSKSSISIARLLRKLGEFDPRHDIRCAPDGPWYWSSAKPRLHEHICEYFASRHEDG